MVLSLPQPYQCTCYQCNVGPQHLALVLIISIQECEMCSRTMINNVSLQLLDFDICLFKNCTRKMVVGNRLASLYIYCHFDIFGKYLNESGREMSLKWYTLGKYIFGERSKDRCWLGPSSAMRVNLLFKYNWKHDYFYNAREDFYYIGPICIKVLSRLVPIYAPFVCWFRLYPGSSESI